MLDNKLTVYKQLNYLLLIENQSLGYFSQLFLHYFPDGTLNGTEGKSLPLQAINAVLADNNWELQINN